jgi:glutaminyl-peptide cyclotransferase
MTAWIFGTAVRIIVGIAAAVCAPAHAAVPEYGIMVLNAYPHDPDAFTEGLLFNNGFLYESTGLEGRSSIRKLTLETGKPVQRYDLPSRYFGEGIVIWKDRLIGLTYTTEIGFIYDLHTLQPISDFRYTGEGWALTQDGARLIMSDGTSELRFLNPETLNETGRIRVTCNGIPVRYVNELEWVQGEIYANIWQTNLIARIDPATGDIVGLIDLTDLAARARAGRAVDVLNGIAYDATGNRLFVTGKLWPALYQIALSPRPHTSGLCRTLR